MAYNNYDGLIPSVAQRMVHLGTSCFNNFPVWK